MEEGKPANAPLKPAIVTPEAITGVQMHALEAELERTGVPMEAVKERYRIDQPENMTEELYKKVMAALAKTRPAA